MEFESFSSISTSCSSELSLLDYSKRFTCIDLNKLSKREQSFIKENINMENCNIINISALKSGKLISLLIADMPDNYKTVEVMDHYYLVKWKKTNGDYFYRKNKHLPHLRPEFFESSKGYDDPGFMRREYDDFIGYRDGMGCEIVDITDVDVPTGRFHTVIDNSVYYDNQNKDNLATDENIIDTSIFNRN